MTKRTKVLVVDDSALMRQMLTSILSQADDIEVVGSAPNADVARRKINKLNPDVVTLDVELPGMDGLAFLEKIMRLRPTPVVMISGLTQENSEAALLALEIGAVDVIAKSKVNVDLTLLEKESEIVDKVRAAARAKLDVLPGTDNGDPAVTQPVQPPANYMPQSKVVVIGASAGGVEAIREVLTHMPPDCPSVLITQHMPVNYTRNFAARLDRMCPVAVRQAGHLDPVQPGTVYIAPGDRHLELGKTASGYRCVLSDGEEVSGHKPSVDVLFHSAARTAGSEAIGVILTGMGRDGSEGLMAMRRAGALTLGQDERSSMIYGMPRVAFEAGAIVRQLPLKRVAPALIEACRAGDGEYK
ncbi:MAG: chemotaxis response regulator protein-glutamate methylesterase [Alphaproteobacteria bacterium]|jgi:two-component system chemotaxis response regulator CheB|nr:chemotaxis response regulator protein-glutamate methylesterase [Alphaproteobacteria bacterium]MDP6623823.1 chemotaxis response regulator protein-glutamate methylesterase [Alphaproteobacteria bacterium]|tara:strand:- start:3 stop:1073 length:1071 start_codon:yes stop_codon:yes gene_type:complete